MKIKSISYKILREGNVNEIVNQMWSNKGFDKQSDKRFQSLKNWTISKMESCKELINEKQYFHYSLSPNLKEILFYRDVNKKGEDEFISTNISNRIRKSFYTDKNNQKVFNLSDLNKKENETIQNEIERDLSNVKIIKGFSCYKITLIQKIISKNNTDEKTYSMYATKETFIPGHILLNLPSIELIECPLEVSIIDSFTNKQKTIMIATSINAPIKFNSDAKSVLGWSNIESTAEENLKTIEREDIIKLACG